MWIIAGLYILLTLLSIFLYCKGCNLIGDYEKSNNKINKTKAIKKFKTALLTLIISFLVLTLGLILRLIIL